MLDNILFVVFPYVAVAMGLGGGVLWYCVSLPHQSIFVHELVIAVSGK